MSYNSTEGIDEKRDVSDAKKPCKGILKSSSSCDKPGSGSYASYRKTAKFDEANVQKTYHPADKDYGHMKVMEPKTPYVYSAEEDPGHEFDPDLLAEKLQIAADAQTPHFTYDENSDEEFMESPHERVHRSEFESRRKAHYNEFKAVLLARKLIQVELENDDKSLDDSSASRKQNELPVVPESINTSRRVPPPLASGCAIPSESMDVGSSTS